MSHAEAAFPVEAESIQDRSAWGRGVLASYGFVTPSDVGRRSYDASKLKLSARDVLLLVIGCLGMYGAQIGAQWGMRSDIRDLKTSFDAAVREQNSTNASLQKQIDEWRSYSKLAYEKADQAINETSKVEGILLGSGVIKEKVK